jgi:hypothetical protein
MLLVGNMIHFVYSIAKESSETVLWNVNTYSHATHTICWDPISSITTRTVWFGAVLSRWLRLKTRMVFVLSRDSLVGNVIHLVYAIVNESSESIIWNVEHYSRAAPFFKTPNSSLMTTSVSSFEVVLSTWLLLKTKFVFHRNVYNWSDVTMNTRWGDQSVVLFRLSRSCKLARLELVFKALYSVTRVFLMLTTKIIIIFPCTSRIRIFWTKKMPRRATIFHWILLRSATTWEVVRCSYISHPWQKKYLGSVILRSWPKSQHDIEWTRVGIMFVEFLESFFLFLFWWFLS